MFFYLVALLKKWHTQEKELAVQQITKELEVANIRNRISSQLHDDIGSTLSGISMYSYMASTQLQQGNHTNVQATLQTIQQSASEVVNKMGDVVWSVKTGQDSLQLLFERLGQYGFDMCKAKNIDFKTSILISHFNIPAENRYQLYLFCKEAINNAVKYSDAGLLELTAKEEGNLLEVNIADNGKGFDSETVKRGNGLNNMLQRANELGADFKLLSKRGGGCLISLKVKIT